MGVSQLVTAIDEADELFVSSDPETACKQALTGLRRLGRRRGHLGGSVAVLATAASHAGMNTDDSTRNVRRIA